MNTKRIEEIAVNLLCQRINLTENLSPYINTNDKEPAWDGFIYIYKSDRNDNDNLYGRLPVQVKGHNSEDLSADEISFSVEISQLRNYYSDGGLLYFVVYFHMNNDKTDYDKRIYYVDLMPDRLMTILSGCKSHQKTTSIRLNTLPISNDTFVSIVRNCYDERRKQRDSSDLLHTNAEELAKEEAPGSGTEKDELDDVWYHDSFHFMGREALTEIVVKGLRNPKISLILVRGMAGIGKTEICKAAYREIKHADPTFTMPMVDLDGISSLQGFLAVLADRLGISIEGVPLDKLPSIIVVRIRSLIIDSGGCGKLIVFLDNFETLWLTSADEQKAITNTLWKLTGAGLRMLISSQVDFLADMTVTVDPLDGDINTEGLGWENFYNLFRARLFLETLGRDITEAEKPAFVRLTKELEGHPLAIVLAASYGRTCGTLDELLDRWHSIDGDINQGIQIPSQRDQHKSLTKALALAWSSICQNPSAAVHWAFHAHSLFPLDETTLHELCGVYPDTFSDNEWQEGKRLLISLGLLQFTDLAGERMLLSVKKPFSGFENAEPYYKAAFRAWISWGGDLLKKADDRKKPDYLFYHTCAVNWLPQCWHLAERCLQAKAFTELNTLLAYAGNLYQFDPINTLPLLQRIIHEVPDDFQLKSKLYWCLGDLLRNTGNLPDARGAYEEAEKWYRDERDNTGLVNVPQSHEGLLSCTVKVSDELKAYDVEKLHRDKQDNIGLANEMKLRGDLLSRTGRFFEAQMAYELAEKLYQDERKHHELANVLKSHGDLLIILGNYYAATRAYEEAEKLYREEKANLGLANVLRSRGDLLSLIGDPDGARKEYDKAEKLYRDKRDNLSLANVQQYIKELLSLTDNLDNEKKVYDSVEKNYIDEPASVGLANVKKSQGDLLICTGELGKALRAYDEAEKLYQKKEDSIGLANILLSCGDMLRHFRKYHDAKKANEEAEKLYGVEKANLGIANVLQSRGDLLQAQKDWPGATPYYEKAIALYRLVNESMGLCYTLAELQYCRRQLGDEDAAQDCIKEIVELLPNLPEPVNLYMQKKME